jgi:isopenicillin N synthase-like dioxygenase
MLTLEELTGQLREKSHAIVPFSLRHADFQQAIDRFVRFLALPLPEKEQVYYNMDLGDDRGADIGYQRRLRSEGKIDNREFFHYHPIAEEKFSAASHQHPELRELLDAARRIYNESKQTMSDVLRAFDASYPGLHARFFPEHTEPNFCVRFLKYDMATPGEFLAKGHYDRGGCTLALAESAPGLRIGIDDLHLRDVIHDEGKALFMPGLSFPEFTNGDIPPTWHDVVQKGEDAYSPDIARWAIVFFADTYIKPKTTWEDRHRPQRI